MKRNPIEGQTIRWTFEDGPMAKKSFEHDFGTNGEVTFRMLDGDHAGKASEPTKYEVASVGADVHAVSYLSSNGYTLTVVLDEKSGRLVAFASNEKSLTQQKGKFEIVGHKKAHSEKAHSHASR